MICVVQATTDYITSTVNYVWIFNVVVRLLGSGMAGFVLANGGMSANTSGEGDVRKKLIEDNIVDCMIAPARTLF